MELTNFFKKITPDEAKKARKRKAEINHTPLLGQNIDENPPKAKKAKTMFKMKNGDEVDVLKARKYVRTHGDWLEDIPGEKVKLLIIQVLNITQSSKS